MTQAGYVLTGGRSSRFGSDKARYEIDGRPLAWITAEKVRQAAGSVALVGAPQRYADLGLRLIADPREDFGPAAGIVAALEDSCAEWNLIVAVDMVGVTIEFLRFLLDRADEDVVMPVQPDGRDQPLCCAYRTTAAAALRAQMEAGVSRVTRALEAVRVRRVLPEEYARFGGAELFENLNRPG